MIFERFLKSVDTDTSPQDYSLLYGLIKRFEGIYLKAYLCPAGVWTVGYGSTGKDITPKTVWTKEYAEYRMMKDCEKFIKATIELCPNTNHQQTCAIASFAYNVGINSLKTSTFRKRFNAGDIEGAKKQLMRWNKAKGKVLPGLVKRRAVEASLL